MTTGLKDKFTLLLVLVSAGVACTNISDHRLLNVDGMRDPRKINKVLVVIIIFMVIYHVAQSNPQERITRLCQAFLGNLSSTDKNDHNDVTGTGAEKISLDDIYVSIKTTGKFHASRVALILKTWWDGMKKQAYFFTDVDDIALREQTNDHVVVTDCGITHNKWWCHFDDDNYVNPSMLVDVLNEYNWKLPLYLGRLSRSSVQTLLYGKKQVYYRFATGGAGICITRSMSVLIAPWVRNGSFVQTCRDIHQPDDVTFGFIVTNRVGVSLTSRHDFNAHTQDLMKISRKDLLSQVVLSYSARRMNGHVNVINLPDDTSAFPFKLDRSRMLSYHCMKYPHTDWCPRP